VAAGACSALEAAKDEGLVTDEEFDKVLNAAAAKITGHVELPPDAKLAGKAANCKKVMAGLQKAGESRSPSLARAPRTGALARTSQPA
jgi:hypothetical protein